jgi:hypothetical protein
MSRDPTQTPRLLTASEYVLALFEPSDNVAILVRNRATGRTVQRIAKAETIAHPDFQTWLANQNAGGSDIFIGMNPIKDGAYSRTKDSIHRIRHVYLDLDKRGDESLAAIRNSPAAPPPNFVLHTSPGKHQVVWKVDGLTREEAESLLRSLANQFGGDPAATDSTRVLRLPGFANRKLSEEFIVQARQETDAVYALRDFTIHEDSPEAPLHLIEAKESKRAASGHRSQSENDWAYAKRALARGDDPEEIIRRIADFRAGDKPSPEYYARHTVTKAQAELRRQSNIEESAEDHQTQAKETGLDY